MPYFLNGAPISSEAVMSWFGVVLSVLVFGMGISIAYLFVFNRKTRQSLHDMIVGSYVVRAAGEIAIPITGKPWRGHYAVAAIIMISALAAPFVAKQIGSREPFARMLVLQHSLMSEPEVKYATVMVGTTTFTSSDKGTQTQSNVSSRITLSKNVMGCDALANKLARIILDSYPESAKKDAVAISISHGYDIGIASYWQTKNFSYSPSQWRERLGVHPLR